MKILIKRAVYVIALVLFSSMFAVGQDTYMFEAIYLTPKDGANQQLEWSIAEHNKVYHPSGGKHASLVRSVLIGERAGDYVWLMGPTTFAALDDRPGEGGHDDNWANTVMPHVAKLSNVSYWRRDKDRWYTPDGYSAPMTRIRYFRINNGMNNSLNEHYDKILKVYRTKKIDRSTALYRNTFTTAKGPHVAIGSGLKDWASLDDDSWVSMYEEVHGKDSWQKWIKGWSRVIAWQDQEVWKNLPMDK